MTLLNGDRNLNKIENLLNKNLLQNHFELYSWNKLNILLKFYGKIVNKQKKKKHWKRIGKIITQGNQSTVSRDV